jgi:hypothetical protein
MEPIKNCPIHNKRIHTVCTLSECSSKFLCSKCINLHSNSHTLYFNDYEDIFGDKLETFFSEFKSQNISGMQTLESLENTIKKNYFNLLSDYLDKIKSFYDQQLETFLKEIRESYKKNAEVLFNLESVYNVFDVDGTIKFFCEIEKRQIEVKNLLGALTKINDNLDEKFKYTFDFSKYEKEIIFTDKLKYTLPSTIKVYEKVLEQSNIEYEDLSFQSNENDGEYDLKNDGEKDLIQYKSNSKNSKINKNAKKRLIKKVTLF